MILFLCFPAQTTVQSMFNWLEPNQMIIISVYSSRQYKSKVDGKSFKPETVKNCYKNKNRMKKVFKCDIPNAEQVLNIILLNRSWFFFCKKKRRRNSLKIRWWGQNSWKKKQKKLIRSNELSFFLLIVIKHTLTRLFRVKYHINQKRYDHRLTVTVDTFDIITTKE